MPIYKIDLPPLYGPPGKLYFDEIELSEANAEVLVSQKVISLKGAKETIEPKVDAIQEIAPPLEETAPPVETPIDPSPDAELLEFFNNASVEDLGNLRNIGKTRAEKIKSHAPYTSLADIQAQSGLSNQGWSDAIADLIP